MRNKIVVVGGGYAGCLAAVRAARLCADVTLISENAHFSERIRLHERAARDGQPERTVQELVGEKVHVLHARATELDLLGKSINKIRYDKLILAIGCEGLDWRAVEHIRARAHAGGPLTIAGGGLTGLELATELAEAYPKLQVTLVTRGEIGEAMRPAVRAHALRALDRLGVTLREHSEAEHADIVTGGFTAHALLKTWGLACADDGRAEVDACLRAVGFPDVYVAGDAANIPDVIQGCKSAMPLGARGAENAVAALRGEDEKPFTWRHPGTCISLGRADGIIQGVGFTLRGRLAAYFKERVCRYTVASIDWERNDRFNYRWAT